MVARFGMSEEIGFVSVLPVGGNGSALMPGVSEVSERTRQRIDDEIRRIVREREALNDAIKLLAENRHRLDTLAEALVSAETLGENEAYAAAGIDAPVGVTRRRSSRQ